MKWYDLFNFLLDCAKIYGRKAKKNYSEPVYNIRVFRMSEVTISVIKL